MAIGNVELRHERSPKHFSQGTSRLKWQKQRKKWRLIWKALWAKKKGADSQIAAQAYFSLGVATPLSMECYKENDENVGNLSKIAESSTHFSIVKQVLK